MTGGKPGRGAPAPEERPTSFQRRVLPWGGAAMGLAVAIVAAVGAWDAFVAEIPAEPSPIAGAILLSVGISIQILLGGGFLAIMVLVVWPVVILHADRVRPGLHGGVADALRDHPAFGPTARAGAPSPPAGGPRPPA